MKKIYFLGLLFLFGIIVLSSCRKGEKQSSGEPPQKEILENAKLFFKASSSQQLAVESKWDQLEAAKPMWENAGQTKLEDGSNILTVSLKEYKLTTKKISYLRKYVFTEKNGIIISGNIVEIFGTPEYLEKEKENLLIKFNQTKIKDFTGSIILYNLQYRYLEGRVFRDGHMIKGTSQITKNGSVDAKRYSGNIILATETNCTNWYVVTTYHDATGAIIGQDSEYLYTSCSGGNGGQGDGGGSPPGGGAPKIDCAGVENGTAYKAACGCIGGTTLLAYCPRDPCYRQQFLTLMGNNESVAANKNTIINNSTSVEWGAEQNSNVYPGSFGTIPTTPRTNSSTGSFTSNFVWNPYDGYTTGIAHGHPGGTGPSPADAFWPITNLNNPDLVASGGTNFYKETVTVTTYLPDGTGYLIEVENWQTLMAEYQTYLSNPTAYNNSYISEAQNYMLANNSSDVGQAGVWALMSKLGNAVQIFKSEPGSNSFVPVEKIGFTVQGKPCYY